MGAKLGAGLRLPHIPHNTKLWVFPQPSNSYKDSMGVILPSKSHPTSRYEAAGKPMVASMQGMKIKTM